MITLKSVQSTDYDRDETELITSGSYEIEGDTYTISYDETEATGFDGSKTMLTCWGNKKVSMDRTGEAESHLIIEKAKKHHCHYGTPFGEFMVGIYTHAIENNLTPEGGKLYLKYTVDINSSYISDNEIYVSIRI